MEKRKRILSFLVVAIIVFTLILMVSVIYKKSKTKNEYTNVNIGIEKEGYYKINTYEYELNGKVHDVSFNYSAQAAGYFYLEVYVTIGIDGKVLDSTKSLVKVVPLSKDVHKDSIYNSFGPDNIKVLHGSDKDYFVIHIDSDIELDMPDAIAIISKDAKVIKYVNLGSKKSMDIIYDNEKYGSNNHVLIEEDAIYYVMYDCNEVYVNGQSTESTPASAYEYKLTMKDGELTKEVVRTVDISSKNKSICEK